MEEAVSSGLVNLICGAAIFAGGAAAVVQYLPQPEAQPNAGLYARLDHKPQPEAQPDAGLYAQFDDMCRRNMADRFSRSPRLMLSPAQAEAYAALLRARPPMPTAQEQINDCIREAIIQWRGAEWRRTHPG
jgi:hypothetical protein